MIKITKDINNIARKGDIFRIVKIQRASGRAIVQKDGVQFTFNKNEWRAA